MNDNYYQYKPTCFPQNCYLIGPTGPTGPAGNDGLTPIFTIGTVETGEPGTNAEVTITEN